MRRHALRRWRLHGARIWRRWRRVLLVALAALVFFTLLGQCTTPGATRGSCLIYGGLVMEAAGLGS